LFSNQLLKLQKVHWEQQERLGQWGLLVPLEELATPALLVALLVLPELQDPLEIMELLGLLVQQVQKALPVPPQQLEQQAPKVLLDH
jgi:hypothetical protein